MTYIKNTFVEFITALEGFDQLPDAAIANLSEQLQAWRYRIGQKIIGKESLPEHITIIYEGQVRLLGYDPQTQMPITLKLLQPGEIIGETGLLRDIACETAIASTEVVCLTLSASAYFSFLGLYPAFADARKNRSYLVEVFDILSSYWQKQAIATLNLKELAENALPQAKIHYLPLGKTPFNQLDSERVWFVSGGGTVTNLSPGDRLESDDDTDKIQVIDQNPARLLGIHPSDLILEDSHQIELAVTDTKSDSAQELDIPYASDEVVPQTAPQTSKSSSKQKYPFFSGKGELNTAFACFQMIAKHLEMPFRREVVRRILTEQVKRQGTISFQVTAYLAELIGLKAQLIELPIASVTRIPTPALIRYDDSLAVLYAADANSVVVGVPSQGIVRCKPAQLVEQLDVDPTDFPPKVRVLLLTATKETPQERFSLRWFLPYLSRHRRVLIEVFVASFFVQLAALANPLVVQLIIDKVITQNSIGTLHILGVLLLVVGLFEAVLTTLRTYLFVDTTNRIDMGLGSQIIDHLLRLPLRYFERRPVGELSTRINELENIRQFLTGTALTVGLDALFSLVYIGVMLIYSWQLTLVGLSTIP
ncbi:MAG: ABC transporter transmembrane domain-containing protein, partial [Nostoc sp.]|uniref:ABC transporter transmembrane domain-containing protein n=1 Tax=Nostoc sp. TaxID=1180 RepID=UPI002FEF42F4